MTIKQTVKDVMSADVQYIASNSTLDQAATRMRDLDCGFLPIGDSPTGVLQGVITLNDIERHQESGGATSAL